VKQFLDALEVPYTVIRRVRHYQPADVRAALDKATVQPRAATPEPSETGPPNRR
jgi:hypothetical protein